jgi:hypothetical protein
MAYACRACLCFAEGARTIVAGDTRYRRLPLRSRTNRFPRRHRRIELVQRNRSAIGLHDAAMVALQRAGMRHAARASNDVEILLHLVDEVLHPHRFVRGVQTALQAWVVGGDARWAGVLVAFLAIVCSRGRT